MGVEVVPATEAVENIQTDPVDAVLDDMDAAVKPVEAAKADPKGSAAAAPGSTTPKEEAKSSASGKPTESAATQVAEPDDLGRLTQAANDLRVRSEAIRGEDSRVKAEAARLEQATKDFEAKVTQTKDTYKSQISLGAAIQQMQGQPMDAAELVRLVYGDDVDLSQALESLTKGAARPVTAADLRRVQEEAKAAALSEFEKRQEAQRTKAESDAATAEAEAVAKYRVAADGVMAATGPLLETGGYPKLQERLTGLEMGYTENFVQSDGRKVLTLGDRLLTILNEHVKTHGRPQSLPEALKELEESLSPKPQVTTPTTGSKQPAGTARVVVPSASQRAGAGTRAAPDPKSKSYLQDHWDDFDAEIKAIAASSSARK